jgi:hypothetical protein
MHSGRGNIALELAPGNYRDMKKFELSESKTGLLIAVPSGDCFKLVGKSGNELLVYVPEARLGPYSLSQPARLRRVWTRDSGQPFPARYNKPA